MLTVLVLLLAVSIAPAQQMIIHTTDGGSESFNLEDIDRITFDIEGHQEQWFALTEEDSILMIWIPPGEFWMGAQEDEQGAAVDEYPRHLVMLDYGFWIGKYEFTQVQWVAVMGENPSGFEGDNRPVERVSYNDTRGFLNELNGNEDRTPWRLPSESEWEYACRAGTETRFYWGNDEDYGDIGDYSWYDENSDATHEVGQKRPNAWGLYDMSGNVMEWCEDMHHGNYDGAPDDGSVWAEGENDGFVQRGGAWVYENSYGRSANRHGDTPATRYNYRGFRLVRDAE